MDLLRLINMTFIHFVSFWSTWYPYLSIWGSRFFQQDVLLHSMFTVYKTVQWGIRSHQLSQLFIQATTNIETQGEIYNAE